MAEDNHAKKEQKKTKGRYGEKDFMSYMLSQ